MDQNEARRAYMRDYMRRRRAEPEYRRRELDRENARAKSLRADPVVGEEIRAAVRARYAADPRRPASARRWHLKRSYGLTPEAAEALWASQDRRCAICTEETDRWMVDHDHATGRIRGVLCHRCNTAIGLLRDRPDLCRAAGIYLGG